MVSPSKPASLSTALFPWSVWYYSPSCSVTSLEFLCPFLLSKYSQHSNCLNRFLIVSYSSLRRIYSLCFHNPFVQWVLLLTTRMIPWLPPEFQHLLFQFFLSAEARLLLAKPSLVHIILSKLLNNFIADDYNFKPLSLLIRLTMFPKDSTLVHLPSHPQWIFLSFGLEPHLGFSQLLLWLTPLSPSCVLPTGRTFSPDTMPRAQLKALGHLPAGCGSSSDFLPLPLSTFDYWFCPELGQLRCCCFWTYVYTYIFFHLSYHPIR